MVVTVQPRARIASIAAWPTALGALPPDWLNLPFDVPFELIDTNMPSIDACERFVLRKVLVKLVAKQLSKKLAGNDTSDKQLPHVSSKEVMCLTSNNGNDTSDEQLNHV